LVLNVNRFYSQLTKFFITPKKSAIRSLRKKVFTEFKYLVICRIGKLFYALRQTFYTPVYVLYVLYVTNRGQSKVVGARSALQPISTL
jgi:hypothetical protein